MKIVAIIQARMTSTRLPGKVLADVAGKPLLRHMFERLSRCETLDDIVVAFPRSEENWPIADLAAELGAGAFRGSEDNVLSRVLGAAEAYGASLITEATGDCPLIAPEVVDEVVRRFHDEPPVDYCSNILSRTYPRGMDCQVFPTRILDVVDMSTRDFADREHVSLYIYNHPERFRLRNVIAPAAQTDPDLRLTVDTPEDLEFIRAIFEHFAPRNDFCLYDVLNLLEGNPHLREINRHVKQKAV